MRRKVLGLRTVCTTEHWYGLRGRRHVYTFLQMWSSAHKTPTARSGRPARLHRRSAAKPATGDRRVLVEQVRILGAPALAKVLHLHHLREQRHIHGRLGRLREVVPPQDLLVLVERTLVPVFLQELLLSLWLILPALLCTLQVLAQPLLLRQCAPPLDLLAFELACERRLFVALDARELAQAPGLELGGGVEPVRVVHIGRLDFLFLYGRYVYDERSTGDRRGDVLSASSRRMLSATISWLCFLRSSASSSFLRTASSVSSAIASFSAIVARARLRLSLTFCTTRD